MDGSRYIPPLETDTGDVPQADGSASVLSIEQLQRLVRLLEQSDVSELELRRAEEGIHLVLRKARAPESNEQHGGAQFRPSAGTRFIEPASSPEGPSEETEYKVVAPLVGIFHVWARPRGGALVAVGDRVKAGQLVGTIESLNVLNEVETAVAGRVSEILVQEGQPVEYGQVLMIIEAAEGA